LPSSLHRIEKQSPDSAAAMARPILEVRGRGQRCAIEERRPDMKGRILWMVTAAVLTVLASVTPSKAAPTCQDLCYAEVQSCMKSCQGQGLACRNVCTNDYNACLAGC
jgi:hypothetical protein